MVSEPGLLTKELMLRAIGIESLRVLRVVRDGLPQALVDGI